MNEHIKKVITIFIILLSYSSFADGSKNADNHALVIIDMQSVFMTRGGDLEYSKNKQKVKDLTTAKLRL